MLMVSLGSSEPVGRVGGRIAFIQLMRKKRRLAVWNSNGANARLPGRLGNAFHAFSTNLGVVFEGCALDRVSVGISVGRLQGFGDGSLEKSGRSGRI